MPFSEAAAQGAAAIIKRALSGLFFQGQLKCPGGGLVGRSAAAYKAEYEPPNPRSLSNYFPAL